MLPWLKSTNLWLAASIVAMVVIVFMAGERHERRKNAAELAERNIPLAEMRGRDEAEIPAENKRLEETAAGASQAVTQSCPVTAETARLIAAVK